MLTHRQNSFLERFAHGREPQEINTNRGFLGNAVSFFKANNSDPMNRSNYNNINILNDDSHDGLYVNLIINQDEFEDSLIVACRGTDFNNLLSSTNNLDVNGPASSAIASHLALILKHINKACEDNGNISRIIITGHSQGGASAQLLAAEILKLVDKYYTSFPSNIVDQSEYQNISEISNLDIVTFQSAPAHSVVETVNASIENIMRMVRENNRHFSLSFTSHINKGDIVHRVNQHILRSITTEFATVRLITMGDELLSTGVVNNIKNINNLTREDIYKIVNNILEGISKSHTGYFYDNNNDLIGEADVFINSNSEHRDIINYILGNVQLDYLSRTLLASINNVIINVRRSSLAGRVYTVLSNPDNINIGLPVVRYVFSKAGNMLLNRYNDGNSEVVMNNETRIGFLNDIHNSATSLSTSASEYFFSNRINVNNDIDNNNTVNNSDDGLFNRAKSYLPGL